MAVETMVEGKFNSCQISVTDIVTDLKSYVQRVFYNKHIVFPHSLKNLKNIVTESNDELMVTVVFLTLLWGALRLVFTKYIDNFMAKRNLDFIQRGRLSESCWFLTFYIVSTIFCMMLLVSSGANEIIGSLQVAVVQMNDDKVVQDLSLHFSILYAFLVHKMYVMTSKNGFDVKFVILSCYLVFLACSYSISCIHFGLMSLVCVGFLEMLHEGAKLLYNIRSRGAQLSFFMRGASGSMFFSYCTVWFLLYVFIFPLYFIYPAVMTRLPNNGAGMLLLMNISLWAFCCMEFYDSPLLKAATSFLTESSTSEDWLEDMLFENDYEDIKYILKILKDMHDEEQARKRPRTHLKEARNASARTAASNEKSTNEARSQKKSSMQPSPVSVPLGKSPDKPRRKKHESS